MPARGEKFACHVELMCSNSVDAVSYLMDTYPHIAALLNNKQQNALHVSLEFNAVESYQTLVRYHSPDLNIRSEDIFGHAPIDMWMKVMEKKRELDCSDFPHMEKKPLILVTTPYDEHQTCEHPPRKVWNRDGMMMMNRTQHYLLNKFSVVRC